jgi:hypothetical protein
VETNNEELLIAGNSSGTTDILSATIDRGGYERKATDSFKRVHDIPGQRRGHDLVIIIIIHDCT